MNKLIDLTGQRFGRLEVMARAENSKSGKARWICRCKCGSITVVTGGNLRNGNTQSCGCYQREVIAICNTTHGDGTGGGKTSRLYGIWAGMKQRCCNKNNPAYNDYGGRGIHICDEWKDDFDVFRSWATSHGYADNLSIDRKDVNRDYSPDNCRWATGKQQCNNQRSNVLCDLNGELKTIAEWAEVYSIGYNVLQKRITRAGMSLDEALTRPVRKCSNG